MIRKRKHGYENLPGYLEDFLKTCQIPYPMISLVTKQPQTISGWSPLTFHCRNFRSFTFSFRKDSDAADVFDSVKDLTVVCTFILIHCEFCIHRQSASVSQLYAFYYTPNPPLVASDGWTMYSPRHDLGRMGVGTRSKAWRFTNINKDYSVRHYCYRTSSCP